MTIWGFTLAQRWTLAITATRALAAIALQKLIAMGYGPAGVLLLGQLLLVQGLCYGLLTDGVNRAAMVAAGQATGPADRAAFLAHGARTGALLLFSAGCIVWLLVPSVLPELVAVRLPVAAAIAAGGLYWWAGPILQFEKKPVAYWSSTAWVSGLVVVAALVPISWLQYLPFSAEIGELSIRLYAVALAQALGGITVALPFYARLLNESKLASKGLHVDFLRQLGAFGAFSLAVLIAGRGADIAIRSLAMQALNMDALGMWQASVRLGDILQAPFIPLFMSLFFAQAAQMGKEARQHALFHQLRIAGYGVLAIAFTVVVGPWLLATLNRPDFALGIDYYRWQAPGDAIRLLTLPISVVLLVTGRIRSLAWLEALSLFSYLLFAYIGVEVFGTLGLAIAHTLRYVVFGGATAWVAREVLWPKRYGTLPID